MNTKLLNEVHTLAKHMRIKYPHLREGQALMNALFECNIKLYKQITGTDADCFYVDAKIQQFWSEIANS